MRWILVLSLLLMGFTHPPKFREGQCALFKDQPGRMDREMVVRVEGFENGRYKYRWWTFQRQWAIDLGKVVAKKEMFERLFIVVDCPDNFI